MAARVESLHGFATSHDALYERVADGAWRIASRATKDEHVAIELVRDAFREHVVQCGTDDHVCVLRHVIGHAQALAGEGPLPNAERRGSTDVRVAMELLFVGGVRVEDVAAWLGCDPAGLSARILDAVRPSATAVRQAPGPPQAEQAAAR